MGDDESPEEAAKRELKEEVGIEPEELRPLTNKSRASRLRRRSTFYFLAPVKSPTFEISSGEIKEAGWFSKSEVLRLLAPNQRYIFRKHLKGSGQF
jgi:NADH pyrophosphatase NudC (nudix superfamily)